jgi:hypothetical protein
MLGSFSREIYKMKLIEKGAVFLLLLIALMALPVSGQESEAHFGVTVDVVNGSIFIDGQAFIELTIANSENYDDNFRISIPSIEWSVQSDPLYQYFSGVDVPAFSSQKVRLFLKPTVAFSPGYRTVNVVVQSSSTKESQLVPLFVNIRSTNQLLMEYLAAVSRIVEIPAQIDPRSEFEIKVNLVNRNIKNLSNMKIVFSSVSSNVISKEIVTDLRPLESKEVSTKIKLDSLTSPVKDTLKVVLYVDGQPLEPAIFEKFEIIGYSEIKATTSERKSAFLQRINETVYVNEGNIVSTRVVESKTSFFKSLFTKTSPKAYMITKAGHRLNAWELTLGPQQQAVIRVTESYRSILYLFLIAAFALLFYRFFQSPVQLVKESSAISYKEGGVSELKVILRLKNRSKNPYVKLTVADRIPMIAQVEPDTMGTMKPATIFNDGRGVMVKWEIENLDKHEERILAYKIKSKLSILGQFTLPKASLRFYTEKNVKYVTGSNMVTIKP